MYEITCNRHRFIGLAGGGAALTAFDAWGAASTHSSGKSLSPEPSAAFNPGVELELTAAQGTAQLLSGAPTRLRQFTGKVLKGDPQALTTLPGSSLPGWCATTGSSHDANGGVARRTAEEARRQAEARANEARGREEEARRAGARAGADDRSDTRPATFDLYGVLRISRGASQETIRKAYRSRIAMYHPDKVDHLGEEFQQLAGEKTRELIRAYEMLRRRVLLRERR